jgi:ferric-dicitrate binding protein FerR (iron transport regulator)
MNEEQKLVLLNKYMEGGLTSEEELMFFNWYAEAGADEFHRLLQQVSKGNIYEAPRPEFLRELDRKLREENGEGRVRKMRTWWWAAAAVLLLVTGSSVWLVFRQPATKEIAMVKDVTPGRTGAILTLANGDIIELDSLKNGVIATQQGTSLILQNGTLSYNAKDAADVSYNTIRTPKARQFQVVLPDGSEVWLNAGSSLKYPTAFIKGRVVEISGEAYFEVTKNAAMPFKVKMNEQAAVEVLGTKFNVNAYSDEKSIDATLLEGSVRVNAGAQKVILRPGQQAQLNGTLTVNDHVNTDQVIAWKTGIFNFDGLGIEAVMRQLSRWYDIEVIYEQGIPSTKFYGEIGRNLNLSQVLEGLKLSGVHFRIENGQRLIVLP